MRGGSVTPPPVPGTCSKITDIEHVVILIQETGLSITTLEATVHRGFSDQAWRSSSPDPCDFIYRRHILLFNLTPPRRMQHARTTSPSDYAAIISSARCCNGRFCELASCD